jgi:ParB/RepB/Spo0J family partition protein
MPLNKHRSHKTLIKKVLVQEKGGGAPGHHKSWPRAHIKLPSTPATLPGAATKIDALPVTPVTDLASQITPTSQQAVVSDLVNKTFSIGQLHSVHVDQVRVGDDRRPLNRENVRIIADSISMVGMTTPIILRRVENESGQRLILVAGLHRLAAVKALGHTCIDAIIMEGDAVDARLREIVDNLHRAELTVLDRARFMVEWERLAPTKAGQLGPPIGGTQPHNSGISATAKELQVTRQTVRRARVIAAICAEAKAMAVEAGIADN